MYLFEYQIKEFMAVLKPIQARLIEKYGSRCIYEWRQMRLNRPKRDDLEDSRR